MPELPEVESLRRYLVAERVPGRVITSATADWPGVENTVDGAARLSTLPGRRRPGPTPNHRLSGEGRSLGAGTGSPLKSRMAEWSHHTPSSR